MAANSYVAANGQTYYRDVFSGDGLVGTPIIPKFADTTAHTKIDSLKNQLSAQLPGALSTSGRLLVEAAIAPPDSLAQYGVLGTVNGAIIKNSPGFVFSLGCTNLNATTRYLQLFNKKTSVPAANEVPFRSYPVFGGGFLALDTSYFGDINSCTGLYFNDGITFGFSSTALIYTGATAADCIFEMRYR